MTELSNKKINRPIVYDYESISGFLREIVIYNKSRLKSYSLRRAISQVKGCSTSLVSQVLNNKRRLTRDQLPLFSHIFMLNETEVEYIDKQLKGQIKKINTDQLKPRKIEKISNHILKDWINVYVKDTCELSSFKLDAKTIYHLLGEIAPVKRIQRSMDYLLYEGFWKKSQNEEVKVNETAVETTCDIPSKKIKQFHRKSLDIAKRGLEVYPTNQRFVSRHLLSVDQNAKAELNLMIRKFQQEIKDFIEAHPGGDEELLQINLCMIPIGGVTND